MNQSESRLRPQNILSKIQIPKCLDFFLDYPKPSPNCWVPSRSLDSWVFPRSSGICVFSGKHSKSPRIYISNVHVSPPPPLHYPDSHFLKPSISWENSYPQVSGFSQTSQRHWVFPKFSDLRVFANIKPTYLWPLSHVCSIIHRSLLPIEQTGLEINDFEQNRQTVMLSVSIMGSL